MRPLCSHLRAALPLCLAALLVAAGCSSKRERATVKGKVTLGTTPLAAGTVMFQTPDGRYNGAGTIDAGGNYQVSDAPVGETLITVTVPRMRMMPGMKGPGGAPVPPPASGKAAEHGMKMPNMPDPSKIVPVPDKYADPKTSGLKYTVQKGEQTHNITLTP